MPRNPLDSVIRMRRVAIDDARRILAACLRNEAAAKSALQTADALIVREGNFATDLSSDDRAVEAYFRWLPMGRDRAASALEALERTQAAVTIALVALNAAKAAAEAASNLLARRAAEDASQAARKVQQEIDEAAAIRRDLTSL